MSEATWHQIHASLTALGLVDGTNPTFRLRRLVQGQQSLLDVLTEHYGEAVIRAVEHGRSWQLSEAFPEAGQAATRRFESLVRGALRAEGRNPARATVASSKVSDAFPSRDERALAVLQQETEQLREALQACVSDRDFDGAERCQVLLHRAIDKIAES